MKELQYTLNEQQVAEYFDTAKERYYILLRRRSGQPRPWSEDKVFQDWFFCNVFREDDRVTTWIRENMRDPHRNEPKVLWHMVAARVFNRIETLNKLLKAGIFDRNHWSSKDAEAILEGTQPVTGAAYCVRTPWGLNKLKGCLKLITNAAQDNDRLIKLIEPGVTTLEQVHKLLLPGECMGPFMAYEIVTDLRYTYLLENAPDIMTWASPGPGACLGLSRLVGESVPYGNPAGRAAAVVCMRDILQYSRNPCYWPQVWPRWDMRTVEHWLCEHAKWHKVRYEGKRMKRRYNGIPTPGA